MTEGRNFGWNDTISNDGEDYSPLAPGDYNFEITNLEKAITAKGANMAKLTFKVYDDNHQGTITDNIVLNDRCEWKISQFFRSIGLKKHGETIKMQWDKVLGAKGRLRIKKSSFIGRDGTEKESREVDRYFDPVQTQNDTPW